MDLALAYELTLTVELYVQQFLLLNMQGED